MIPGKLLNITKLIFIACFGLTLMIPTVGAAEPHFSGTPTVSKNSDDTLTANYKASSLGKNVVTANLSGVTHSQLQCVNPGGNNPTPKKVDFKQCKIRQ